MIHYLIQSFKLISQEINLIRGVSVQDFGNIEIEKGETTEQMSL